MPRRGESGARGNRPGWRGRPGPSRLRWVLLWRSPWWGWAGQSLVSVTVPIAMLLGLENTGESEAVTLAPASEISRLRTEPIVLVRWRPSTETCGTPKFTGEAVTSGNDDGHREAPGMPIIHHVGVIYWGLTFPS